MYLAGLSVNLPIDMFIVTVPCTSPAAFRYALAPALNKPTSKLPFQTPLDTGSRIGRPNNQMTSLITYNAIGLSIISFEIYACHPGCLNQY